MLRPIWFAIALCVCVGCSKAPTNEARTVEFSVPDMMCPDGCGVAVESILSKQAGAKEVLIDFENKKAIVAIEDGKFDSDKALAALVDKQFTNSSVAESGAAKPQAAEGSAQ
jgi:copper chaperone CopZ